MTATPLILVVDDAPEARMILYRLLMKAGYQVLLACDGTAAVQLAQRHDPDVVLLDVVMPDMDGWTACERIRRFTDAYILMVTSQEETSDKLKAFERGADDYVTKPFASEELVARVAALLTRPPIRARRS